MSDEPNERASWECTTPHPLHPRWPLVLLHCPICGSERPARREGAAAAEDRTEELASINHELVAAHNALLATLAAAETRAEAAERKIAAVEALADEWESTETIWPSVPRRLRAALLGATP